MSVSGMACLKEKGELVAYEWEPLPLGDDEIDIRITCCGMCHSDLHQIDNDWKGANYPLVPGHEIIGEVTRVGASVRRFAVGDTVGVGPQVGSCDSCAECARGERQLCARKLKAYNSATGDERQPFTYGGYARSIQTKEAWAFAIPEGLDAAETAPLLCAGITTWKPLLAVKDAKEKLNVGILGFGGLGHVAVQFAVAFGHTVTVLSHSPSKEADAKEYGAGFLNTGDAEAVKGAANRFDFILSTVSAWLDYNKYLRMLRPKGTLALVGLPSKKLEISAGLLVASARSIVGSYLANRSDINEMLAFCAEHKVRAKVQKIPLASANEGIQMLRDNSARYRVVLQME